MSIGVYRDLAVGADASGAEPWIRPETFAGASIGAPPDLFNPKGQNWGAARATSASVARRGLRVVHRDSAREHAMRGRLAHRSRDGAATSLLDPSRCGGIRRNLREVSFDDLLAILALESQRQRCVIIGEDLGTVPADSARG